ncbi:MAG TPA: organic hydroperoxide resistance protein [Caulobacterales bacterium]|nr:organic hydroperoxide resistance protein [Caulobacterales bacterium]
MAGPTKVLATMSAHCEGGRANGKVALSGDGGSTGRLYLHTEHAKGLGGSGEGTNPEQLFAMGYATCFNGAVLFVAAQKKLDAAKAKVTVEVDIGPNEAGGFALAARLKLHVPGLSTDQMRELIEAAHMVCPYSNATRGNMPVELSVE